MQIRKENSLFMKNNFCSCFCNAFFAQQVVAKLSSIVLLVHMSKSDSIATNVKKTDYWSNSPMLGNVAATNLLLSSSIMLSGSLPSKVLNCLRFMGIAVYRYKYVITLYIYSYCFKLIELLFTVTPHTFDIKPNT